MDHHCPWLNSCLGFENRKYFIMLLIYAVLTIALFVGMSVPYLIKSVLELYSLESYNVSVRLRVDGCDFREVQCGEVGAFLCVFYRLFDFCGGDVNVFEVPHCAGFDKFDDHRVPGEPASGAWEHAEGILGLT